MNSPNEVARAVVLAGGVSRRMGEDKAFLRLGEETLVSRLVRGLQTFSERVGISVASADDFAEFQEKDVELYIDERWRRGPLEGLRSSLRAMSEDYALFVAVDTPTVWVPLARHLFQAARSAGRAAIPRFGTRLQVGFAVYGRDLLGEIERCSEDTSLYQIADWPGVTVVDLNDPEVVARVGEGKIMPDELFWSVNTPEERDRLRQAYSAGEISGDAAVF